MEDLSADIDALRTVDKKFLKPMSKVVAVFERAVAVRGQVIDAEARLAALQVEQHTLEIAIADLSRDLTERQQQAKAETEALQADLRTLRQQVHDVREEAGNVGRQIEADWREQRVKLDREHEAHKATLQSEITNMELRHQALQEAVNTLKAGIAAIGGHA